MGVAGPSSSAPVINYIFYWSNISKGTAFLHQGVTNCKNMLTISHTLMKKGSAFGNIGQNDINIYYMLSVDISVIKP